MDTMTPTCSASFAACSQLFASYPLAVTPHGADDGHLSMVLLNRSAGSAGFFVLIQVRKDLFFVRSWDPNDGVNQGIGPQEPVPGAIHQVITGGMPVPHDGALLGWVTDSQVTAMLAVHCRQPDSWDAQAAVPEISVMPMAGTSEVLHWPPFSASPLGDSRLWEYIERGEVVDLGPLVTRSTECAFWVPSPDLRCARYGYVVVPGNLPADEYWLPAGVYLDHWALREGIQAPPAGLLLRLPGVVDLAHALR